MTIARFAPIAEPTAGIATGTQPFRIGGVDLLDPYLAAARANADRAEEALEQIESFQSGNPEQRLLGYRDAQTGNYTVVQADNGYDVPFTSAAAHIVTLPAIGSVECGTQVQLYRAPGAGTVSIVGLTSGGISHPNDHTSIDINGSVVCRARPGIAGVNGGAPYWWMTGQTLP